MLSVTEYSAFFSGFSTPNAAYSTKEHRFSAINTATLCKWTLRDVTAGNSQNQLSGIFSPLKARTSSPKTNILTLNRAFAKFWQCHFLSGKKRIFWHISPSPKFVDIFRLTGKKDLLRSWHCPKETLRSGDDLSLRTVFKQKHLGFCSASLGVKRFFGLASQSTEYYWILKPRFHTETSDDKKPKSFFKITRR